jgi:predicted PurR-regulated permease PerM
MTESNKWLILTGLIVTGVLLYLLAPVLTPFLTGALLAYLGDPLADRLEARKIPRTGAVIIVFVVILIVLACLPLVLLPMIEQQFTALVQKLPKTIDWFQQQVVPWLSQTLNIDSASWDAAAIKQAIAQHWSQMGGIATRVVDSISHSGLAIVTWLANLVLIPVVTFYLLRDWDVLVARLRELLPRKQEPVISRLARESDEVLGSFLRGQLSVMLALGVIYTIGLWIAGLDLALLVGMIAGLVSFVPYLGFIVGIVLAGIASIMQFHDALHLIYVVIVFGVGQAMEGMVLTPLLVGDKIGLHPVAVIFAVMAGGQLFGFVGILLALPVAAVIMVLLRYVHERYTHSSLYGQSPVPPSAEDKTT